MSKLTFKRTAASQFSAQDASQGSLSCFPLRVAFYSFLDVFFVQLPEENVRKPQTSVGAKENKRLAFLSLCLTDLDSSEAFPLSSAACFVLLYRAPPKCHAPAWAPRSSEILFCKQLMRASNAL